MKEQKFTVRKRRRREGRTDYNRRLKLLLSKKPRFVVRKSIDSITVQLIEYSPDGDKVVASAHSNNLKKMGWKFNGCNLPASYLAGMMLAAKARKKNYKEAILDMGLHPSVKGSRIYAAVKGAVDNGLSIPHSADILPDEDSVSGKRIVEFAKKTKAEGKNAEGVQFSKFDADEFQRIFNDIRNKLKAGV